MKKAIFALIIIVALFAVSFFIFKKIDLFSPKIVKKENQNTAEKENNKTAEVVKSPEEQIASAAEGENKIPDKVLLDVPFVEQAPLQNWDALHEDACEEASLITVEDFIQKKSAGSAQQQEKEIQNLVSWETKNGYGPSITLDQLNSIAKSYYHLETGRVETNINVDDIKKELAAGHPVIVGAAGKVLPNPNFKNGGPNYHMLVVIGYDENGFITNDPGTKKGENFRYTFQGLFNAIHDWNAKNILDGGKDYLVFD